MLLECAFEAAENAGLPLDRLSGSKTGVFSAQGEAEYGQQMVEDLPYVFTYPNQPVAISALWTLLTMSLLNLGRRQSTALPAQQDV